MTEDEWQDAANATELWAFVRSETRLNRHIVDKDSSKWDDYNQRLLYLLGVAACRRVEDLFPDPCCQRVMRVAEAYAEGSSTLEELLDAHDALDIFRCSQAANLLPAAKVGALEAAFWLSPDDYKVIRALDFVSDAAGYLRAVEAGVLPGEAPLQAGKAVWKHSAFLAGKADEERCLCDLIRDVIGNPFYPAKIDPSWLAWSDATIQRIAETIYADRAFDRLPILADALLDAGCDDEAILSHCRGAGPHVRGCWVIDLILGKG